MVICSHFSTAMEMNKSSSGLSEGKHLKLRPEMSSCFPLLAVSCCTGSSKQGLLSSILRMHLQNQIQENSYQKDV